MQFRGQGSGKPETKFRGEHRQKAGNECTANTRTKHTHLIGTTRQQPYEKRKLQQYLSDTQQRHFCFITYLPCSIARARQGRRRLFPSLELFLILVPGLLRAGASFRRAARHVQSPRLLQTNKQTTNKQPTNEPLCCKI